MTLEDITEGFREQAAKAPSLGKTLKFELDEGPVYLDLTGDAAQVSNDDKEADCTISMSTENLMKLREGKLNPMMAVMTGKVKIKGDMGLAMKLKDIMGG